jgi:hypothetical protein
MVVKIYLLCSYGEAKKEKGGRSRDRLFILPARAGIA